MTEIRIDAAGEISTDPVDFEEAVALVGSQGLSGIWIRSDFLAGRPGAPTIDLSLLRGLTELRSFGISEDVGVDRLLDFPAVYSLGDQLETLAMYTFPSLDLSKFHRLEVLMLRDDPKVTGFEQLAALRQVRLSRWRRPNLSILANSPRLAELKIVQATPEALVGLEQLRALTQLELSHCIKLRSITPLPPTLKTLSIERCPKLTSLDFLRDNPSVETVKATTIDSLAFVPSMARISYINFGKLVDRDLSPVLASSTMRQVHFLPKKSYSHSPEQLNEALATRR
ncbi:MAG: hypothetical protein HC927_08135 [Deltaproteobacteria bacterium]|nr:hypothetical protein [Deltaproteobacteria bacterium]